MSKPCILIIGDSFAAEWSVKYKEYKGWPTLLAEQYPVVNLAQAGVSEYKIYQQLTSAKLDKFDLVIVSHTSPWRVPTKRHPVHSKDLLHANADLMLADIEYHYSKISNFFNQALRSAYRFFMDHYDYEYFETTYRLLRKEINRILVNKPVIVISSFAGLETFPEEKIVLNFPPDGGIINHMTNQGNQEIYNQIVKIIEKLSTENTAMEEQ
jgi:hypothetical protein